MSTGNIDPVLAQFLGNIQPVIQKSYDETKEAFLAIRMASADTMTEAWAMGGRPKQPSYQEIAQWFLDNPKFLSKMPSDERLAKFKEDWLAGDGTGTPHAWTTTGWMHEYYRSFKMIADFAEQLKSMGTTITP